MAPSPPRLGLHGISKRYGATEALTRVSLELRPGSIHALIGENGAGKSTLLNIIGGVTSSDSGRMSLDGMIYSPNNPLDARNAGIAFIHQELSLCPHLTVAENIVMGREPARRGWIDQREVTRVAMVVLANFPRAGLLPDQRVSDLPIAARQIVEICRAIAARARILLMDEPTSSLERRDVERLFAVVRRLRADGLSVVYISHMLEEVREVCDRFTVLRDGAVVGEGELASVGNDILIGKMVGRTLDPASSETTPPVSGDPILVVNDLVAPGVRHASFELRPGEVFGIAGLVGAGRTELIRALYGLAPVRSGEVRLRGLRVPSSVRSPAARVHDGVGFVSEDRKGEGLALPLSVADNITLTRLSATSRLGWISRRRQLDAARRWMNDCGVRASSATQRVGTLSGGNQQKVAVARLFHQDADIFLLDDPTRGIDIGSKETVYGMIRRAARTGKAVLVVSSFLPELFTLCDRLAVMHRGRLSAARPISDWTPELVLEECVAASGSPLGEAVQ